MSHSTNKPVPKLRNAPQPPLSHAGAILTQIVPRDHRDFVFTSPYDYRIDRETYFKHCWPYREQSPTYETEKMLERDNEAFILYDCKIKNGGRSRNTEFFTIEGNKIKEVEVYFGSAPKEPA